MSKLEAELYSLTHRGNPGDVRFYAHACRGASSVLELGTGYGRLVPSLLQVQGRGSPKRRFWGLEREPQLLTLAKSSVQRLDSEQRRCLTLVAGDMRDFDLSETFDRIVLPYNGLYCLLSRRDLKRCLGCVRRHLAPGGAFVFDVWAADRFHRDASSRAYRDESGAILSIVHRSRVWDVYEKSHLRRRAQRLDVTYTYVSRERGTQVSIPIAQRYSPSNELRALLASNGFRITSVFGDFQRRRYGPSAEHLILCAA